MKKLFNLIFFLIVLLANTGCQLNVKNPNGNNSNNSQIQNEKPLDKTQIPIQFKKSGPPISSNKPIFSKELDSIAVGNDGQVMVYEKNQQLYLYTFDNKKLENLKLKGSAPMLSDDGKTLLFRERDKLYITDLVTMKTEPFASSDYWVSDAGIHYGRVDISSNGKRIVYERGGAIYFIDRSNPRVHEGKISSGNCPSISQNGELIAYYSDHKWDGEDMYYKAYLTNLPGHRVKEISKNATGYFAEPMIFINNSTIVFGNYHRSYFYDIKKDTIQLYPYILSVSSSGDRIIFSEQNSKVIFVGDLKTKTASELLLKKDTYPVNFTFNKQGNRMFYSGVEDFNSPNNWHNKLSLWMVDLN